MRTIAASLFVGAASGAFLWVGTDGFRALTSEQARRVAIARAPREIPDVALQDQDGKVFTFAAYRGRPLVVDFVFTQCATACPLLSAGFQRLGREQRSRVRRVPLLSVSFDPRDTPEQLKKYSVRWGASPDAWRFARVKDPRDLERVLRAFDIVVIPDGRGDFQHNAAVHVVDTRGRLARILDAGASLAAVDAALGGASLTVSARK